MKQTYCKISLEGMRFYAFHGVYKEEQAVGRMFIVDVHLNIASVMDGHDELGDSYNYEWIYEVVKEEMNIPKKLLETFCYNVAKKLLAKSALLESGEVIIRKEGVVLGGAVDRSVIRYGFERN